MINVLDMVFTVSDIKLSLQIQYICLLMCSLLLFSQKCAENSN